MNERLCDWIEEELDLRELAENLRQSIAQNGSVEQFVTTILAHSSIYTTAELKRIQEVLETLKNQKPIEKQKYKADNLLKGGAIKQAILIYLSIVHGEKDDSVENGFYGKVYGCLGTAYGRLFLYEEAARMYEKAFQICEKEEILTAYVYACRQYMKKEEYKMMLQKSPIFQGIEMRLQETIQDVIEDTTLSVEDTLENWKEQYRKIGTGER